MPYYTVTVNVPSDDDDVEYESMLPIEAMDIQEAQNIACALAEVKIDKVVSSSWMADKMWKRSDIKVKKKGNA